MALSATLSTPELGFYGVKIIFWIELLTIFAGMTLFAIALGCVLYHYCVRPEAKFTTTSYLVGYGFILPFWLAFPYYTSLFLGVQNKVLRFTLTTCVTSICSFRTTAAIHGFSPKHTTKSMRDFVFYYAAPVLAKYDPKTQQYVKTTLQQRLRAYAKFCTNVCMAGMVISCYKMFPQHFPSLATHPTTIWYDWRLIFDHNNLKANLLRAVVFQLNLMTFTQGMSAIQGMFTRIATEETMDNPVFCSTCPSDFWGKRWNLLIHDVLKRGVFLPVRRHASITLAVLATFFASGIFHEWLQLTVWPTWDHTVTEDGKCHLIGYDEPVSSLHCYSPQWGAQMAFFMWQAVLIALEFALEPHCKGFFLSVPAPVKTMLTMVVGGCVTHWFSEPYIHSNFFLDGEAALFMIKRME